MTDGSWWGSDPEEQPVPLVPDGQTPGGPHRHQREPSVIADEAERIVMASQDAMTREDTDPTLPFSFPSKVPGVASRLAWGARPVDRTAVALLVLGCLVMFLMGWMHGSPATDGSHPSARDDPRMSAVMGFTSLDRDLGSDDEAVLGREEQRPSEEVRTQ